MMNGKRGPEALRMFIAGRTYGLTQEQAGELFGLSRATFAKRMQTPGSFTVDELISFCRRAQVPVDELREAIRL